MISTRSDGDQCRKSIGQAMPPHAYHPWQTTKQTMLNRRDPEKSHGVSAEPHPVQVKAGKRREGYPHLLNYQLFTHRRFPYKMYPRLMRQQLWPINAWQHSAADHHRGLLHGMIGLDVYTAARTSDSAMLATVP